MGSPVEAGLKLNVDGVSKPKNDLVAAAGVIRDSTCRWVVSAARNLNSCPPLLSELWVASLGLHQAWDHGFKSLVLETDCQKVVDLLTGNSSSVTTRNVLLNKYKELLGRNWSVEISHIYREANAVADGIANWVLQQPIGQYAHASPPPQLHNQLLADQQRILDFLPLCDF